MPFKGPRVHPRATSEAHLRVTVTQVEQESVCDLALQACDEGGHPAGVAQRQERSLVVSTRLAYPCAREP